MSVRHANVSNVQQTRSRCSVVQQIRPRKERVDVKINTRPRAESSHGICLKYQAKKLTLSEDRRFASTHPAVPPPTMMYLWPSSAADMLTTDAARAAGIRQVHFQGLLWIGAKNQFLYLHVTAVQLVSQREVLLTQSAGWSRSCACVFRCTWD